VLEKWLRDSRLANTYHEATQYYIESLKIKLLDRAEQYVKANSLDKAHHSEIRYRIASRFFSQKFYLDRLETKDFELDRDEKGGRVYHPLTSMFKGLRNFYTFDKQALTSLDIKSSQPYLLLALLQRDFWKTSNPNSLSRTRRTLYQELHNRGNLVGIIKLWNSYKTQSGSGFPNFPLVDAVINDDIYLTIAKMLGSFDETNPVERKIWRDKGKRTMMWFMYGDFSKKAPPPYITFKKRYPFEVKLMEKIKDGGHELFPILLQGVEAYLILERIVPKITRLYPDLPIYTIHDSIITLTSHHQQVKEIMEQELEDFVGRPAMIDIEHLSPDRPNLTVEDEADLIFNDILASIKQQTKSKRAIGDFHLDLRTLNVPWKKVMPHWNGKSWLSTRFLPEEEDV
jgi:hypothetical protein